MFISFDNYYGSKKNSDSVNSLVFVHTHSTNKRKFWVTIKIIYVNLQ